MPPPGRRMPQRRQQTRASGLSCPPLSSWQRGCGQAHPAAGRSPSRLRHLARQVAPASVWRSGPSRASFASCI
eukprot:692995-Heterocapsa_arctica.AAC.1